MIYNTLFFSFLLLTTSCFADETYLSKDQFLGQVFGAATPQQKVLWLNPAQIDLAEKILNHPMSASRFRYWTLGNKKAWIINEIGKENPITIGLAIESNQIASVNILQFRESRGWEVRYPFFTQRFIGLGLKQNNDLTKTIDGITGATLSVKAVTNSARLALYLSSLIPDSLTAKKNHD